MVDDLPPALRGSSSGFPQKKRPEGSEQSNPTPAQIREQAALEAMQERNSAKSNVEAQKALTPIQSSETKGTEQAAQKKNSAPRQFEAPNGLIYSIHGDDIQFVEITLKPGFSVIGEESNMMYYDDGIEIKSQMNADTSKSKGLMGKIMDVGKAAMKGEQVFITTFTNKSSELKKIAFSTPYPGKVLPIDVSKMGGSVICHKFALMCAAKGIHISQANRDESGAGMFDNGTKMDRLEGNGFAFICLGGTSRRRKLAQGEILHVNQGVMAARQASVGYKIKKVAVSGLSMENNYRVTESLIGPGVVWLQSLPFNKVRDSISKHIVSTVAAKYKKGKK